MCLCKLMIIDYLQTAADDDMCKYGVGYDNYDLFNGIEWARYNLEIGIKTEDYYNINLRTFIKWCKHKIKGEK